MVQFLSLSCKFSWGECQLLKTGQLGFVKSPYFCNSEIVNGVVILMCMKIPYWSLNGHTGGLRLTFVIFHGFLHFVFCSFFIIVYFVPDMENLAFGTTHTSLHECIHWPSWLWTSYCQAGLLVFTSSCFWDAYVWCEWLIGTFVVLTFTATFHSYWDVHFLFGCLPGTMIDLLLLLLGFWALELGIQWWVWFLLRNCWHANYEMHFCFIELSRFEFVEVFKLHLLGLTIQ